MSPVTLLLALMLALPPRPHAHAQLVYPSEDEAAGGYAAAQEAGRASLPPTDIDPATLRGTSVYEQYVERIISRGIARFALDVNADLMRRRGDAFDSVVFAPMSIGSALALILLGSNGKTFQEISSVLGLAGGLDIENRSERVHAELGKMILKLETTSGLALGTQVDFAVAVFVQNNYPIRSLYKATAEEIYQSEILNVDFASNKAQQVINAWVSNRTKGKIKNILTEMPSANTKVIIASAMYFKAPWEKPFFQGTTTRRPFFTNGRKSRPEVEVEMMANGGSFPYYKDPTLQCEIMGFPYKGNATVLYVVMPFNSNTKVLRDLEATLTPANLEHLADSAVYTRAITLLPKMRIESTLDLKSTMVSLGVKSLFEAGQANLALLSPGEHEDTLGVESNPLVPDLDEDKVLIFSRTGEPVDCSGIFERDSNVSACRSALPNSNQTAVYKKIGGKIGRRVARKTESLDELRRLLNDQSTDNNKQNPGLYADKIVHKVFMDITESGTEAAASTSVSLSRDGTRVTFRVDVPFLFFIRHEETKVITFWGSVNTPTPYFKK